MTYRLFTMDAHSDSMTQNRPLTVNRRYSGETSVSDVFGFPLAVNQYSTLEANHTAEIQSSEQEEDVGLVDPRTTRILRRAAMSTAEEGSLADVALTATVSSPLRIAQGNVYSGTVVNPVASEIGSQNFVQHSFSACPPDILQQSGGHVSYVLGHGAASVRDGENSLYDSFKCNKRISCAGPEWSAGRPGHMPTRRILECDELIEDSRAGQDWSAGRPGLTPFGARTAICLSPQTAYIGPYCAASA